MGTFDTQTVLNTSQPLLAKDIINAIEKDTILLKYLRPKGGMDFSKGGYKYEWNINADAMLQAHAVNERGQVFTPVPNHRTRKAAITPATIAFVSTIDKTEAKRATGPTSPYKNEAAWIGELMKPSVNFLMKELEQYMFMGQFIDRKVAAAPDSFNGLVTLDPEFTSGSVEGNANGVFDTNTFETQSKTVLSLACDDAYRWASQTSTITGFGGGVGPRIHRRHLNACRRYRQASKWRGRAFMDDGSFETFWDWRDSRIVYIDRSSLNSDLQDTDEMFTFGGIPYHKCYNIDPSTYSDSDLTNGVTFFIDEDQWEGYLPDGDEMAKSLGEWVDGMKSALPQNSWVCAGTIDLQFWPKWLASQGIIKGGGA